MSERGQERELEISAEGSAAFDDFIVLRYRLRNSAGRTLHAYAKLRRIFIDDATRTLNLLLHDRGLSESSPSARHLLTPPFLPIAAGGYATLGIRVPRKIRRLDRRPGTDEPAVSVSQSTEGVVTIGTSVAYSDTPFYYLPKGESMVAQLNSWSKDVLVISHSAAEVGWPGTPPDLKPGTR